MSWFCTYSLKKIYILDLQPDNVDIETIAHSLALQCRWMGHIHNFYSVAEHSVRVAAECFMRYGEVMAESEEMESDEDRRRGLGLAALGGLLHDASEAYGGDVISPIKGHTMVVARQATVIPGHSVPETPGLLKGAEEIPFKQLERNMMEVIADGLGLPFLKTIQSGEGRIPSIVEWADKLLLVTEARDLYPQGLPHEWENVDWPDPAPERINPMTWQEAQVAFMEDYAKYRRMAGL